MADKPLAGEDPINTDETAPTPRMLGTARGEFVVPDDFDDPLPDDMLAQFDGKPV